MQKNITANLSIMHLKLQKALLIVTITMQEGFTKKKYKSKNSFYKLNPRYVLDLKKTYLQFLFRVQVMCFLL